MAKPPKRLLSSLQRLYSHPIQSNRTPLDHVPGFPSWKHLSSNTSLDPSSIPGIWRRVGCTDLLSKPASPNGLFSRILSRNYNSSGQSGSCLIKTRTYGISPSGFCNPRHISAESSIKLPSFSSNGLRYRFFSAGKLNSGRLEAKVKGTLIDRPLNAVSSAFSRYREAGGLQVEAFWNRNYLVLVGAAAVGVCIVLWRIMFGVASTFVGLSEGMAKYGFLALATAMVAFSGMYLRARFAINPDKIYRIAMRKLNTSAAILEVMGAPLAGTAVRAYVMSGGGPKLKNLKMRLGGKRCFLIFPIRGSERKGLVSVEVKKKKGQYDIKLLAVDIPMAAGPDQRLYLIGNEEEYKIAGGLIAELRDPIIKAMAAEKEFEDLDEKEEEEDAARELAEAERKHQEEEERALEEAERKHQEEEERALEEAERKKREFDSLEKAGS